MYTFVQQRWAGGGSRRDPNHKSMYKCAYMYVHLSLSPFPPPPPPPDETIVKCKNSGLKNVIDAGHNIVKVVFINQNRNGDSVTVALKVSPAVRCSIMYKIKVVVSLLAMQVS